MTEIKNIYKEMDLLIEQIDGEDALEEVKAEYIPFEHNTTSLLESNDLESFLSKYGEICTEDIAVLECFGSKDAEELSKYMTEKELSFDDLKIETARKSKEALEFLIYEAEEDEF